MKKLFFTLFLITLSTGAFSNIMDFLDECKVSCSEECSARVKKLRRKIRAFKDSCGSGGGGGGGSHQVQLYHSDSCSSSLIASIGPMTDCSRLAGEQSTWGVKVNGTCYNISDIASDVACERFKGRDIKLYHSDSCSSGKVIGIVDSSTNCHQFPDTGSEVWGVMIDGVCSNISDISFHKACKRFRSNGHVKLYHSDSCLSSKVIGTIGHYTDCSELSDTGSDVWAVKINGKCENISDTSFQSACFRFQYQ